MHVKITSLAASLPSRTKPVWKALQLAETRSWAVKKLTKLACLPYSIMLSHRMLSREKGKPNNLREKAICRAIDLRTLGSD